MVVTSSPARLVAACNGLDALCRRTALTGGARGGGVRPRLTLRLRRLAARGRGAVADGVDVQHVGAVVGDVDAPRALVGRAVRDAHAGERAGVGRREHLQRRAVEREHLHAPAAALAHDEHGAPAADAGSASSTAQRLADT